VATAKQVKESLLKQIETKGAKVDVYTSLIDDYIWFWHQERAMQKDIRERGRTYTAISSAGKEYEKNNPSVGDALKYNKQMVAILSALGLDTKTVVCGTSGTAEGEEHDL
jgi:hypothetical protein